MTVSEKWESQEVHETVYGTTLSRIFNCTWSDWNDNVFDYHIGDAFSDVRSDLRIADITLTAIDNINVCATILYSTDITIAGQAGNPDSISSWEGRFDIAAVEFPVKVYTKYEKPESESADPETETPSPTWATDWATATGLAESLAPDLYFHRTRMSMHLTAYASTMYIKRILSYIGKINSNAFLNPYYGDQAYTDDAAGLNDVGKWLLIGCPITAVRYNVWRYDLTFIYDDDGWNVTHGVTTNQYRAKDMLQLFDGMTSDAALTNQGASGH